MADIDYHRSYANDVGQRARLQLSVIIVLISASGFVSKPQTRTLKMDSFLTFETTERPPKSYFIFWVVTSQNKVPNLQGQIQTV